MKVFTVLVTSYLRLYTMKHVRHCFHWHRSARIIYAWNAMEICIAKAFARSMHPSVWCLVRFALFFLYLGLQDIIHQAQGLLIEIVCFPRRSFSSWCLYEILSSPTWENKNSSFSYRKFPGIGQWNGHIGTTRIWRGCTFIEWWNIYIDIKDLVRLPAAETYCWWFRNPANQLRLVVYPHYLPGF